MITVVPFQLPDLSQVAGAWVLAAGIAAAIVIYGLWKAASR